MILWMALGVGLFFIGGSLLVGLCIIGTGKDAARVMDLEMSKGVFITILILTTLLIYGGYAMFSSNLLVAASVLQ